MEEELTVTKHDDHPTDRVNTQQIAFERLEGRVLHNIENHDIVKALQAT